VEGKVSTERKQQVQTHGDESRIGSRKKVPVWRHKTGKVAGVRSRMSMLRI
jgi:hypothetical protein